MKEIIPALPGHTVLFLNVQGQVERAQVRMWEIVRRPFEGPDDMPIDLCIRYFAVPVVAHEDIGKVWALSQSDGRWEIPGSNMVFNNESDAAAYLISVSRARPMEVA